jgi:hypothetical protein
MLLVIVSTVLALNGTAGAKPSAANRNACKQMQKGLQQAARKDPVATYTMSTAATHFSGPLSLRNELASESAYLVFGGTRDQVGHAFVTIALFCAEQGIGFDPGGKRLAPSVIIQAAQQAGVLPPGTPPSS